jgi:hypothetical protein
MAIDQRNISADLRLMNDQQLQQYAAMHKTDPYIFPLAFQESQNRQKLRMSGQAKMAGQEQPKVADAALMAMTPQAGPEAQGIGALPAPNMQRMADGGIAGYGDDEEQGMAMGGSMFDFTQRSEPVVRMAAGGVPRYGGPTDGEEPDQVTDEFAGIDDQIAANMEQKKLMGAFDEYSTPTPKAKKSTKKDTASAKKEEAAPALPTYTAKTPEEIRKSADLMAKPELDEIQNAYKPYAEQFGQERERLAKREKGNLGDALMRAGLGMMAGKSQFAMQNIGEGGIQGLNAYQEAQRIDDAARKALMQSEMQMTAAQRAERGGARKDAVTLTHEAERSQQMAMQLAGQSEQIKNTKAYQDTMGKAALMTAGAAQSRAAALNANAGAKGALTEAQLARVRDTARDNITKDANFMLNQMKAEAEAKKAGKPFDSAAWQASLVDAEVERLLANTSRGAKIDPSEAPTGGKLGSGTFNISGWGQPQVVTPK